MIYSKKVRFIFTFLISVKLIESQENSKSDLIAVVTVSFILFWWYGSKSMLIDR